MSEIAEATGTAAKILTQTFLTRRPFRQADHGLVLRKTAYLEFMPLTRDIYNKAHRSPEPVFAFPVQGPTEIWPKTKDFPTET
jgi:hypothetical protein